MKQTSDGAKILSCTQLIRSTNGEEDRAEGEYRLRITPSSVFARPNFSGSWISVCSPPRFQLGTKRIVGRRLLKGKRITFATKLSKRTRSNSPPSRYSDHWLRRRPDWTFPNSTYRPAYPENEFYGPAILASTGRRRVL